MHADAIHHLHNLNVAALFMSAIMIWILGALWYSPALFAKPWMKALGIVMTPGAPKKGLALGMIASFAGDILVSFVLWHMIGWSGASTWQFGAFVGFLCWLGFFAATQLPQGIYEQRPSSLFLINSGYWLVSLLASGALLATWK
jgi:hypothetical protein